MSVAVSNIITNFDTYIGDTSNDRITAAERLQYVTEATTWLQQELGNDHMIKTYPLSYYDNVHYYKITSSVAGLLEEATLRPTSEERGVPFSHKSSNELAAEIAEGATESSWAVERRDSNWYLVVNHISQYQPAQLATFDSLTADGGTWTADTATSDALNVTADTNEFKTGAGSINFDVDVSQSGNNRATIYNSTLNSLDLSSFIDLGAFVFWVYVPDVTYFTGVTLYWGSDSSNYWSASATSDVNGAAWVNGWNRVAIQWNAATMTSSPDETAIDYMRVDFNYSASQADDTDFRIDDLTIVRPEPLTFSYTSWHVGTDSTGATSRTAFSATTDIPFFSGQYDQYKFAVAHKAASLAFFGSLRNSEKGSVHEVEAIKAINRVKKIIPSSITKEVKSFKVQGINFRRR